MYILLCQHQAGNVGSEAYWIVIDQAKRNLKAGVKTFLFFW